MRMKIRMEELMSDYMLVSSYSLGFFTINVDASIP
jgi:hypothetical protein